MILFGLIAPLQAQIPAQTEQLVVVTTPDWTSSQGQIYRFQRQGQTWQWIAPATPVVVGKNGLGWGRGILATTDQPGPQKKEGDGRAPAGAFSLGSVYGYGPKPPSGTTLAYQQSTGADRCVDDSSSIFYNQIVPLRTPVPWTSAEDLVRKDSLYRWLIVVNHNTPARPQSGSCIFLHLWRSPTDPTVGCTAMAEPNLVTLIQWLRASQNPLLVQLPQGVYRDLQQSWGLPDLPLPNP